jgi:hypothetical protein
MKRSESGTNEKEGVDPEDGACGRENEKGREGPASVVKVRGATPGRVRTVGSATPGTEDRMMGSGKSELQ